MLSSPNLLQDPPIAAITWDLLPNGDHGILPPGGNPDIMEEGHIVPLLQSDGFYMVGRTAQGFLAATYTADATAASGWAPTRCEAGVALPPLLLPPGLLMLLILYQFAAPHRSSLL